MSQQYETVIGLEIHAELATASKLFCSCKNDPFHALEPNLYICPVCLGLPGTLPVMNRRAVESTVLVGLALGCEVGWSKANLEPYTKWDRKNYFYPDLPKGYQISQYDLPLVHKGRLKIGEKDIEITRVHLEEDTGRLIHPPGKDYSLIDYNRSGVPLLELVTEPVIRSADEAAAFAQSYQLLLRTLGVAKADMEKGEMRVEANISVRPAGSTQFGTKVEVKNLNSFRSVQRAIAYETDRQIAAVETGEKIIQETRGWNEDKGITYHQRSKETAAEYRYFPEPDLPPVTFMPPLTDPMIQVGLPRRRSGSGIDIDYLRHQLPELPWEKIARYQTEYSVAYADAVRLVYDIQKSAYFEQAAAANLPMQTVANWILNDLNDLTIAPAHLTELAWLLDEKKITSKLAKDLLGKMRSTGKSPRAIIDEEGLAVVRDEGALAELASEVLAANPQAVSDYKAGKPQALGYLIGQAMAKTKGQADPALVRAELERALKGA